MLNVVNFGGGTYVLYAEIAGDRIEVDPDTYGDNFARPARLLPLEAKALVAAIDLFGDHLPQAGLQTARREDRRRARPRPVRGGPGDRPRPRRLLGGAHRQRRDPAATGCSSSSTTRRTRTTSSSARSSRTSWSRARRAGTWAATTSAASDTRHFRLDRMKEATITDARVRAPRGGRGGARRAGVARPRRGHHRRRRPRLGRARPSALAARGAHGGRGALRRRRRGRAALRVERWLTREVLKGVGDLVVLEPTEAREAVLKAVG